MAEYAKIKNKPKTEAELVSEAFTKAYIDLKPNMKVAIKLCKIVSYDSSPEYLYRLQKDLDKVHGNIRTIRGIINSKLEKSADLIDTVVEKNEDKNSEFRKKEPKTFNINANNANNKKVVASSSTSLNQQLNVNSKQATELKNNSIANGATAIATASAVESANNSTTVANVSESKENAVANAVQINAEKQKQVQAALKKEPLPDKKLNGNLPALRRKLKKSVKKVIKNCKLLKKSPSILLMIHLRANIDEAEENIIKIEDSINGNLKKISGFIKNFIEDDNGSTKSMLRS